MEISSMDLNHYAAVLRDARHGLKLLARGAGSLAQTLDCALKPLEDEEAVRLGIPEAKAILIREGNIWRWVVLSCPFCEKKHTHGGGRIGEVPLGGCRVAHCVSGSGREYWLSK